MKYKICSKCGSKVEINSNFCPDCGGKSFSNLQTPQVVKTSKPSLTHYLLYWEYDGQFIISKSKFIAILSFLLMLILGITTNTVFAGVVAGLIFALIILVVGYIIHMLLPKPSKPKLEYNDYGLIVDLKHFLLFWQNSKTGQFVLSRTKIVSILIFVLFALLSVALAPPNILASVLFGLLFAIPAYIIGYGIHKLTNPYPTNPNKVISKPKEVPKTKEIPKTKEVPKPSTAPEILTSDSQSNYKFDMYGKKIDDLESEFSAKEKNVRKLIEKRFAPPQLTYTRFSTVVDKSSELFKNQVESSRRIIDLSSECSPKIEKELNSKIEVLETIIDKLEDLTNELILTEDKSQDDDIHELFDDMENLIKSVKDYE